MFARHHTSLVIGFLCSLLVVAGCGDDDEDAAPATPTSTASVTQTSTRTAAPTGTFTNTPTTVPTLTPTIGPDALTIEAPAAGQAVTTFSFAVVITLEGATVPAEAVTATLNGVPLELVAESLRWTAQVNPGPPLLDDNELIATVQIPGGPTLTQHRSFQYLPDKARARRITNTVDLITGPLAQNKLGDYLLTNDVAHFVVQDAGPRGLSNVGTFGGNLIDAELVGRPGRDEFLELQPMVNVETVIHAIRAEIVNDGQDGTAAVVRTCGPDDTLDFINPSSSIKDRIGVTLPPTVDEADYDIEGCTEYRLAPGATHVELVTTIKSNETRPLGLFVGDFLAGGGQLEPWLAGADSLSGIGEVLVYPVKALTYLGFGASTGVDYGYIGRQLPGSPYDTSDVLAVAGVAVVLHSNSIPAALFGAPPVFVVPTGGSLSYTRFFSVGDGSGGNTINLVNQLNGTSTGMVHGCVTSSGQSADGVLVAIGTVDGDHLQGLASQFVTHESGCFLGTLAPGSYGAAIAREGSPYEGNGTQPLVKPFDVVAGETTELTFELPVTARLHVQVRDEQNEALPARVALVGFDSSPDNGLNTILAVGTATTWLFTDRGDDRLPYGIVRTAYTDASGELELEVEPGEFEVYVSRGSEYSEFHQRLNLVASSTATVEARIAHVVDSTGFVSSDFHVHGLNSTDARINNRDRILQYAGEGIDNIVMTEHGGRTDLNPFIREMGLTSRVHATIGEEITTWEYGHFNGYPFDLVPSHQSGGAVDWAKEAPPGRDFVRYGAFGSTPAELDALARSGPGSRPSTIVQANHIDSYFGPLQIDTSLVPPRSFISDAGKMAWRIDPSVQNLYHHFAALEVWNGDSREHQDRFTNGSMGIWFNELNQGMHTSGTAVTDSHGFFNLNAAGARSWTAAPSDATDQIDPDQVTNEVAAGRVTLGQGVFALARLVAGDGSGATADLRLGGSTIVASSSHGVDLVVDVQAPIWAAFDRIEVYANSQTFATGTVLGTNVSFSANPTLVRHAGADFTVREVDVFPEIAGAKRLEATDTIHFDNLTADTWFVVIVRGSDGVSRPMFPFFAGSLAHGSNQTLDDLLDGNLNENGTLAMAVTNALYADVDGVPGFNPPLTAP